MSLSFWIRDYVFFPLATLRREIWWRNLSLVISMYVFGLWHKGNYLYMIWGIYHGVLLVLHRQWQQAQKRWKIRLPELVSAPLSWLVTFAAVSLGWIFFRAEDLQQAKTLFAAVFSPASYHHLDLPGNYSALVLLAMLGYFGVMGVSAMLDHWASLGEAAGGVPAALARDRWVWVVPLAFVLSLYILVVLHPSGPLVGPMMYQVF